MVSDSLLLFQSIRLFGGSLNEATLLACVVADPKQAMVDEELLMKLAELRVEVDFIRQVNHPFAKTMNKFSAFYRVKKMNFDYFLWLDADVLVLRDPLPLFPQNLQRKRVYCVPEVGNNEVTVLKFSKIALNVR